MSSSDTEPKKLRTGLLTVKPGAPLALTDVDQTQAAVSDEVRQAARQLGTTLRAYLVAAKELLEGKYSNLRDVAPAHMTAACFPKAFIFSDGILIRYDLEPNPDLRIITGMPQNVSLADLAPALSESFLHCSPEPSTYDPKDQTVTLTLSAREVVPLPETAG